MRKVTIVVAAFAAFALEVVGSALADLDFGQQRDHLLAARSFTLFGVKPPLGPSSGAAIDATTAAADPAALATFSDSLDVRVVTGGVAGANIDMMALWPNETDPGAQPTNLYPSPRIVWR